MGQWADFTCDECGLTLRRIYLTQPDRGFFHCALQKYCQKINKIIYIPLPLEAYGRDPSNLELSCPESSKAEKKKTGDLLDPCCENCNSEYLSTLQIMKIEGSFSDKHIVQYKCPCPDCKGTLHIDLNTLVDWD